MPTQWKKDNICFKVKFPSVWPSITHHQHIFHVLAYIVYACNVVCGENRGEKSAFSSSQRTHVSDMRVAGLCMYVRIYARVCTCTHSHTRMDGICMKGERERKLIS